MKFILLAACFCFVTVLSYAQELQNGSSPEAAIGNETLPMSNASDQAIVPSEKADAPSTVTPENKDNHEVALPETSEKQVLDPTTASKDKEDDHATADTSDKPNAVAPLTQPTAAVPAPVLDKPSNVVNLQAATQPYADPLVLDYEADDSSVMPFDPVTGYLDAKNVVLLEVKYKDLPDYVRSKIDEVTEACTGNSGNSSFVKAFSYTSDMIRTRGMSPNYIVDFASLDSSEVKPCMMGPICSADGCLLMTFNSPGYKTWNLDQTLRHKGWTSRIVNDKSASGDPQNDKAPALTVFQVNIKCTEPGKKSNEFCPTFKVWLNDGLVSYPVATPTLSPR